MEEIRAKINETGADKTKIAELNLSGISIDKFTKEMTALLEECSGLELLILSECELSSLEGLPKLPL